MGGLLLFSLPNQSFSEESSSWEVNIPDDSTLLVINDIQVPVEEYQLYLNRNIAITHNYFHNKYGSYDPEGFWEHSFNGENSVYRENPVNGENPLEYLKTVTLEQVVHIKSIQRYAMDIQLIPEFDFNDVKKWWKEDNQSRIEKHNNGEVVFGPVETSLKEYMDYLFSNLVIRLKDYLNNHEFRASDNELESYYQEIKGQNFKYTPSITVEYLEFYRDGDTDRIKMHEQALSINQKIEEGASMKELTAGLKGVKYRQQSFSDSLPIIGEDNPDHDILAYSLQLQLNESKIFFSETNSAIYLMHCTDRMPEQIHTFQEVKQDVLWYYQEDQYNKLIQKLIEKAEVTKNDSLYELIKAE